MPFPGGPAKLVERRPRAAGVLLNEVEPLDGNEQLVFAVIAKLEELLDVATRTARPTVAELFQTDEFADAVIDVDNEIAHFQIAKV